MTETRKERDDEPQLSRRTFLDASLAGMARVAAVAGLMAHRDAAGSPGKPGDAGQPGHAAQAAQASTALAPDELAFLDIGRISALVKAKRVSPVEITQQCLARISQLDPTLNAFITLTGESALVEARRAEAEIMQGRWRGPLHGIPIALKDLIDTAGVRTTSASAVFKDRIPVEDAMVVRRLREAGAVFLGKLNMQEFAYGGTSVPSHYGRVSNPWEVARIAGGSSGGAAAAVAAGLCYAALGSDTGGSIREPAAFCGIVGLKPTHGRVSTRGVIPLSSSLDHIGPLTRTVADAAIVLQVIAGYDPEDAMSQNRPVGQYLAELRHGYGRLRIGVAREFFCANLDAEIEAAFARALGVLEGLGGELRDTAVEVSPDTAVFRAEAYANHAEHVADTPELYLPETLGKLKLGAGIEAAAYIRGRRDLERMRRDAPAVFSLVDVVVTPTTPVLPPKAADYPASLDGALALDAAVLRNTRPFNRNALPTISVPCGWSDDGLPMGLQISGPPWDEGRVLRVAQAFQEATQWHGRRPAMPWRKGSNA